MVISNGVTISLVKRTYRKWIVTIENKFQEKSRFSQCFFVASDPCATCLLEIFLSFFSRVKQARIQGKACRAYAPPPLKISKIRVLRDICIHLHNVHISWSILMPQLFNCLSLAILFLSCRLCSVALIFRGG